MREVQPEQNGSFAHLFTQAYLVVCCCKLRTKQLAVASPGVVDRRFLSFPMADQCAILQTLRWTSFAEGVYAQVPASEWWRLLCLVDPYIQLPVGPGSAYQLGEGRGLLLRLLGHYLDVR